MFRLPISAQYYALNVVLFCYNGLLVLAATLTTQQLFYPYFHTVHSIPSSHSHPHDSETRSRMGAASPRSHDEQT
jgi:hypothetical protein